MALKQIFFKQKTNSGTLHDVAAAGSCLVLGTAGSGFPLGDAGKTFRLSASSSGTKPVGILTQNFVYLDETMYKKNFWNNEQVTGYQAEVIREGEFFTNMVVGTAPVAGDTAYLSSSGYLTKTNLGAAATPIVGEFLGNLDENGYVKVAVNLP